MNKKIYRSILSIIIILAFIVRLVYIIKIPTTERQHDIEPGGNGLSYVETIYKTGKLPEKNWGQFYHPPLHHILSAMWLKIVDGFYEDKDVIDGEMRESLQYLTLIYSMLILYVTYNIFKELKFSKKIKLLLMTIVAFHPALIILSGSINNDELCFLLSIWTIYRLMKWYKKDDALNTVLLAIVTGLSVMTKMAGALIAIPIIFVFLQKLYREMKRAEDKKKTFFKYFWTYVLFGCISLPIGLWYPIRNWIMFKQKLLFIPAPGDFLYVGDKTLWQRITPFSVETMKMYCFPADDFNMISYIFKCSIYGEYIWGDKSEFLNQCLYYISLFTNVLLILFSVFYIIKSVFVKNKRNIIWKRALSLTWLFVLISYISVNIKMPYGCTMDFRYILMNLIIGITFIGFELKHQEGEKSEFSKLLYVLFIILSIFFIVSSNIIILTWKP